MTETSTLWTSGAGGDDDQIDRDKWDFVIQAVAGARSGVIAGMDNELAVSNPSGNTARVASGWAIVDGKPYHNNADLDLTVTTPSVGTTGFQVVLRKSWSAQTVRAAVLMNTDGTSGIPTATQTDGTTWEITLALGTITTGGVISLSDGRTLIGWQHAVDQVDALTLADFMPSPMTPVAIGEVGSGGTLANDIGISSVSHPSTGQYSITFDQEVKHVFCQVADTSVATTNLVGVQIDTALPATTVDVIIVATSASTTATADRDFHVIAYA